MLLPCLAVAVSAHLRIAACLGREDQLVPPAVDRRASEDGDFDDDDLHFYLIAVEERRELQAKLLPGFFSVEARLPFRHVSKPVRENVEHALYVACVVAFAILGLGNTNRVFVLGRHRLKLRQCNCDTMTGQGQEESASRPVNTEAPPPMNIER